MNTSWKITDWKFDPSRVSNDTKAQTSKNWSKIKNVHYRTSQRLLGISMDPFGVRSKKTWGNKKGREMRPSNKKPKSPSTTLYLASSFSLSINKVEYYLHSIIRNVDALLVESTERK